MKLLRILGIAVGVLVLGVAVVAFGARFADGPVAVFPGGPLQSGEWIEDPNADLSFAADIQEIELQSSGRSRTVWILVDGGEAYVPCSIHFPPNKTWHEEALTDPAAVVRIDGKRYRRRLERVEDEALHARLHDLVGSKYGGLPNADPSSSWFFHLAPAS